jgi:hypothetical protein
MFSIDLYIRIKKNHALRQPGSTIFLMNRRRPAIISYLIIRLLVNTNLIIITVNIYTRGLSCVRTIVNITSAIARTKSLVISRTPSLTVTYAGVRRTNSILCV